jgi:hypothetical protein
MGESESRRRAPSNSPSEQPCKFGTIVRALWPDKPAIVLSQLADISERGAQYIIDGERKPPAHVVLAVFREALE